MQPSLHNLQQVSVDIIDAEYCLMYGFPSEVDIQKLKMHLLRWKIPYVHFYQGFLFTWNQLVWFMRGLQNGFSITYEIPPFKYWTSLTDVKNETPTSQNAFIMQPFKLSESQIQKLPKIQSTSIRIILNEGWGYGKTILSLNIAMQKLSVSKHQKLVVIAPSVLHDHWISHFHTYCKDYSIIQNCSQFIQKQYSQTAKQKNIILITPDQTNKLGHIENVMEGFLIYDEIQLLPSDSVVQLRNFAHIIILANCSYRENFALMTNMLCMLASQQSLSFLKSRYSDNPHQISHYYELNNTIRIFQSSEPQSHNQSYSNTKVITYQQKIQKLQAIEEYLFLIFSKDKISSYVFFYTDIKVLGILRKVSDMYERKVHLNHCYVDQDKIYKHVEDQQLLDQLIHLFLGVPHNMVLEQISLQVETRRQFFVNEEFNEIASKKLLKSEQLSCVHQEQKRKTAKKSILINPIQKPTKNKKKRVSFVIDTTIH